MKTNWLPKLSSWYSNFFAVGEIAASLRLQCVFAVSWFICILDLQKVDRSFLDRYKTAHCWVYLSDCSQSYRGFSLPQSYDYPLFMTAIFALLAFAAWAAISKKWSKAHAALSIVILWKFIFSFILVNAHTTNFELFHLIPSFILLFTRNKLRGLKYTWALASLFAARVKFDQGWILGTYFSSMTLGLPLVPRILIPFATNIVIFFEILCSVWLLSRNQKIRKFSFWSWTLFHIYSAIIVGYFYPIRCLGFLWAIFAFEKPQETAVPAKVFMGLRTLVISSVIVLINVLPSFISKDVFSTFEGLDYGFYMINSNYQCQHNVTLLGADGKVVRHIDFGTTSPMDRCFPQDILPKIKKDCAKLGTDGRASWVFLESRNGGPFYRVIDEANACQLDYKPFAHNDWIHLPEESRLVGYPDKNIMYQFPDEFQMPNIHPQPVSIESAEEKNLRANELYLKIFYEVLWGIQFLTMIYLLFWNFPQRNKN